MESAAFYLFAIVMVVLWLACAVNAGTYSVDGGTPFLVMCVSPLAIVMVTTFTPTVVHLLLAAIVYLAVAIRAAFRLITDKEIMVAKTLRSQVMGTVRKTTYTYETLSDRSAVYYWTWQIAIALGFLGYLFWLDYRFGVLERI